MSAIGSKKFAANLVTSILVIFCLLLLQNAQKITQAQSISNPLPYFRFPYNKELKVRWTSGLHAYGKGGQFEAKIDVSEGSGLDFALGVFDVLAMAPGKIVQVGFGGLGRQIAVKHDDGGSVIVYGHLSSSYVVEGQHVDAGKPLGKTGNSVGCTNGFNPPCVDPKMGVHLHVELRDGSGTCVNSKNCLWGNPISWNGVLIDDYHFWGLYVPGNPTLIYNYDGIATWSIPFANLHRRLKMPFQDLKNDGVTQFLRYADFYIPDSFICGSGSNCANNSIDIQRVKFPSFDIGSAMGGSVAIGEAFLISTNQINIAPTPTGVVIPTSTPAPQYGDSRVDIRDNPNYGGTQYGWDNPTNSWFNIPDFLDNKTSSIQLDAGWSIMVATDPNGGGLKKCFVRSEPELSNAYYDGGAPVTDTISSVWVYNDSTCGGQYLGTEPGDTVTVWIDQSYNGLRYGWHDPANGNLDGYTVNSITSIGITPGWSAVLYENQNLAGGFVCFTASDPDLTNNLLNNGGQVNDNSESIEIFHDTNCGGRMNPPIVTFDASVTNPAIGEVTNHLVWSGAASTWQIFNFGDGQNYGVLGSSGDVSPTHNYAPGTYTISVIVYGTDGVGYPFTDQVTISAPTAVPVTPPVLSLAFTQLNQYSNHVEIQAIWSNAAEDWQVVDFGDGTNVGYFGGSGTSVGHPSGNSHDYAVGTYTITFWVKGKDGQTYSATQIVNVLQAPVVVPVVSLSLSVGPEFNFVQADADWANCAEDWQIIDWGDGTNVGYFGGSGTSVGHPNGNTHYYAVGAYTAIFTCKGQDGNNYTASQSVTINAPTQVPVPTDIPAPTQVPPTQAPAPTSVPQPSVSLQLTYDQPTNTVTANATWSNAKEDWQIIDWGDGSNVGYFGSSGSSVGHPSGNTHNFAAGTYTVTFTVKGLDGNNYTASQQIVVG